MTYVGINPHKDINRFIEVKPESSYPENILKEIKLLSFSRNKTAEPFGSFIYRIQKYPGDIDLVEEFTDCCSVSDVVIKFASALKRIVGEINRKPFHYFSEFKAGLDNRYDINIGQMINGVYTPNPYLSSITYEMLRSGLFSSEENNIIQYILHKVQNFGGNEYDTINYIFRERKILRWTDEEILIGIKKLPVNKLITLEEALTHETHVKIDMIAELDGRLVEITNFLQLAYEKDGEIHTININLKEHDNIPVQLPKEIEKLYFSNMYYSPFKMVKRMYSLSRHNLDRELLNKIIPFVSSNTSLLYQIKSEIDTIILILDKIPRQGLSLTPVVKPGFDLPNAPEKLIRDQLDNIKLRISTVLELSQDDIIKINNIINDINLTRKKNNNKNILYLKNLKKILVAYINMQTIDYLQNMGLNPPPNQYLPEVHTYNVNRVRNSFDNPANPYDEYQNMVQMRSHYPNFFEDPNSSAILSQRIVANPGLNEIPRIDQIRRQLIDEESDERLKEHALGGIGNKFTAWWAVMNRQFLKEFGTSLPISFDDFKKLFSRLKKYNYEKMLEKIIDLIEGFQLVEIPEEEPEPMRRIEQFTRDIPRSGPRNLKQELSRCRDRRSKLIAHLKHMERGSAMGEGTRNTAWWAVFTQQYLRNMGEYPPITFDQFNKIFGRWRIYNFKRMVDKISQFLFTGIEFLPSTKREMDLENIQELQKLVKKIDLKKELERLDELKKIKPAKLTDNLRKKLEKCERRVDKLINDLFEMGATKKELEELEELDELQKMVKRIDLDKEFRRIEELEGLEGLEELEELESLDIELEVQEEEVLEDLTFTNDRVDIIFRDFLNKNLTIDELCESFKKIAVNVFKIDQKYKNKSDDISNLIKQIVEKITNYSEIYCQGETQGSGKCGGYEYSYNLQPYMNTILPTMRLVQNDLNSTYQSSGSYASDYYGNGYAPPLKPVYINNAPLVIDGQIRLGEQRAGCSDCGLSAFRRIH